MLFVLLFVGAVLLLPILFCVKVDGDTSASWVALCTPLWVYDALGKGKACWHGGLFLDGPVYSLYSFVGGLMIGASDGCW